MNCTPEIVVKSRLQCRKCAILISAAWPAKSFGMFDFHFESAGSVALFAATRWLDLPQKQQVFL